MNAAPSFAGFWRSAWCVYGNGVLGKYLQILEKVVYTIHVSNGFMQLKLIGELHDIP